ncbi:glycosyltransferase family 25 protein [Alcaligenaceae bacterium C4P045]|nr:glycosyltransferase family 25 protein [Alcaligenaceae bacterium C4P045]
MSGTIPCFVINLATETARREAMAARLEARGLTPRWIDAVDGRGAARGAVLARADMARARRVYGELSPTEVACACSHLEVYRRIVAEHIPHALILEDDVELADDIAELSATAGAGSLAAHIAADRPAMIQLTHVGRGWRLGARRVGKRALLRAEGGVWLTGGYIVTLAAAQALCATRDPIWTAADHWEAIAQDAGLQLHAVSPPCVWEAAEAAQSAISGDRRRRAAPVRAWTARAARLLHRSVVRPLLTVRLPRVK